MIESKYIPGIPVPKFDAAVSEMVADYDDLDGGGHDMLIVVENWNGQIYRNLTTTGLGALMYATQELLSMGFEDKIANDHSGRTGYDAWFVPTPAVKELTVRELYSEPEPAVDPATEILSVLPTLDELPATERQAVIQSRVGQGRYREQLVAYWKRCAVTEAECVPLLRASHIKPWRDATNEERLDPFNGLLLAPNLDAAFDAGFISFDNNGKAMLSWDLTGAAAYELHITAKLKISPKLLTDQHRAYLAYHREHVFRG